MPRAKKDASASTTTQSKNVKKADIIKAKAILEARKTLPKFIEYVLRDEFGDTVTNAEIHLSWWEHLKYCWSIAKNSLILAPMGHAKTQWMSIALPLWFLGQNPNFRIMIVSSAEDQAAKRLQTIGRYIKYSQQYQEVFPWVKPDETMSWNVHRLNIERIGRDGSFVGAVDSSVSAYGYNSSEAVGGRVDILIFDDIADQKNSVIEAKKRDGLRDQVNNVWLTRPNPRLQIKTMAGEIMCSKPIVIFIGTRYHEEDIYNDIILSPAAYCTMIQAISDDFTHLDVEVIGSIADIKHPILAKYQDWIPNVAVHDAT